MRTDHKGVIHISNFTHNDHNSIWPNITNLSRLSQSGFDVQECFVITPDAFEHFLRENNLQRRIHDLLTTVHYDRAESLVQVSNHIKEMVLSANFPNDLSAQIDAAYQTWHSRFKKSKVTVGHSQEVSDTKSIIRKIKETWASHFDPNHLMNANHSKKDIFSSLSPVLVKKVIQSKKSGRLLTKDLQIESDTKLNAEETEKLKKLGNDIHKHLFFPQIINWAFDKEKIIITNIHPLT